MAAAANRLPDQIELLKHDRTIVLLKFLSKLGSGSQGTVYKATIDGVAYAVKSVTLRFSVGKYNRTAFNAENEIAKNILKVKNADNTVSKHICKFYGIIERKPVGETPPSEFVYYDTRPLNAGESPRFYFIYELIAGESLTNLIERGLSPMQIVDYGRQLLEACVAFHKSGIAHNDLKPDNIIIDEHGILKIIDYGLSCNIKDCKTIKGMTFEYGAPEIATLADSHSTVIERILRHLQTDIFSTGCILYELIIGRKLFHDSHIRGYFDADHLPLIVLAEPHKQYEPLLRSMVSFDPTPLPFILEIKNLHEQLKKAAANRDRAKCGELVARIKELSSGLKPLGNNRPTAVAALQMWNDLHPRAVAEVEPLRSEEGLPAASIESRAVVGEIIAAVNATNATKEAKKGGRQTRKRRLSRRRS
jgi:serine/threonine protein kinase